MNKAIAQVLVGAGCVAGAVVGFVGGNSFGGWYARVTAVNASTVKLLTPRERVVLEFRREVDSLQSTLPKRIDDFTVATAVEAVDNQLTFTLQVDLDKGNINRNNVIPFMDAQNRKYWCEGDDKGQTIKDGGIVNYVYLDPLGTLIGKISIDRCP